MLFIKVEQIKTDIRQVKLRKLRNLQLPLRLHSLGIVKRAGGLRFSVTIGEMSGLGIGCHGLGVAWSRRFDIKCFAFLGGHIS